ncbi:MAG: hypothetical protein BWY79_00577 [Actinobacteria bacterium ADurb.Bin444]|nr:MAG: hypothetical protein BWY79_00577 [Actinobacteria bacterium ADurb.Bin444]
MLAKRLKEQAVERPPSCHSIVVVHHGNPWLSRLGLGVVGVLEVPNPLFVPVPVVQGVVVCGQAHPLDNQGSHVGGAVLLQPGDGGGVPRNTSAFLVPSAWRQGRVQWYAPLAANGHGVLNPVAHHPLRAAPRLPLARLPLIGKVRLTVVLEVANPCLHQGANGGQVPFIQAARVGFAPVQADNRDDALGQKGFARFLTGSSAIRANTPPVQ